MSITRAEFDKVVNAIWKAIEVVPPSEVAPPSEQWKVEIFWKAEGEWGDSGNTGLADIIFRTKSEANAAIAWYGSLGMQYRAVEVKEEPEHYRQ